MNFIDTIIGPIAHEQDPAKIRRALELGCSGVIVDGAVPEVVTAEIDRLDVAVLRAKTLHLTFNAMTQDLIWYEHFPRVLDETQRWLGAEAKWAESSGLSAPFNHAAPGSAAMSVWLNGGLAAGWHTDRSRSERWFDVHFHVHGDGIVVADPVVPQTVRVVCDAVLHTLVRDEDGPDADAELAGKGFRLIPLTAGQKLVFSKNCLHRSAAGLPELNKLRGAMF